MTCANHPDVAVAAYCQSCGKPMCTQCMRSVGGVVYCEPCLAARVAPPPGVMSGPASLHANPLLAGLLGFIPGVGAMYNGQFVKALAHVLIFAVFVSLADKSFIFGLLIAAWVFYQVFDAAQTAKARRDGMPLPNPFGLNDLGVRLGVPDATRSYTSGFAPGFAPPPPPAPGYPAPGPYTDPPVSPPPAVGSDWSAVPPPASYGVPPAPGMAAIPPPLPLDPQRKHPVGAIVLIIIGAILLLQTLGIFEGEWLDRTWPLILIGIGGWLLYRRTLENKGDPNGPRRGGF